MNDEEIVTGSNVLIQENAGEIELTWDLPVPSSDSNKGPGSYILWMCGWTAGGILAIVEMITNPKFANQFTVCWLGIWAAGLYLAGRDFRKQLRRVRPERLILRHEALVHDPGWSRARVKDLDSHVSAEPREFAVNELGEVRLEQIGERKRLSFDAGNERIEIGDSLTDAQRAAVAEIVSKWKAKLALLPSTFTETTIQNRIHVDKTFDGISLRWDNPTGGAERYATATFVLFWLGGWAYFENREVIQWLAGKALPFDGWWLLLWSLAGPLASYSLYLKLRPPRPECLTLERSVLRYDPGWAAIRSNGRYMPELSNACAISKTSITAARVDRDNGRQRLLIEHDGTAIEVGEFLSEPEREKLADLISLWLKS
jgi:hypothetical protein